MDKLGIVCFTIFSKHLFKRVLLGTGMLGRLQISSVLKASKIDLFFTEYESQCINEEAHKGEIRYYYVSLGYLVKDILFGTLCYSLAFQTNPIKSIGGIDDLQHLIGNPLRIVIREVRPHTKHRDLNHPIQQHPKYHQFLTVWPPPCPVATSSPPHWDNKTPVSHHSPPPPPHPDTSAGFSHRPVASSHFYSVC